jgi:hypothetical protein
MNTCPWHGGITTLRLHSSTMPVLASFSLTVLFIAKAGPQAAGEVMTLSPRGPEGLQTCA